MAISLATLFGSAAHAAVWGFVPRFNLNARYDENLQLIPDSNVGEFGSSAFGSASITRYDDTTRFSLEPLAGLVRYPEARSLDRDELQISALGTKYFTTAQIDLQSNFIRDTTVLSERGTSGLTESNQPHEHFGVSLAPLWHLTEKWSTSATFGWSNDSYPHKKDLSLVDYDYATGVGQLGYAVTERTSLAVDASFGELTTPAYRQVTHQYTANLHFDTALSERLNLSLSAGPLRVISDFSTDNGIGYMARLSSQSILGSLNVTLGHDVVPNGRGILSKRDRALGAFDYNWSARWTSNLTFQVQQSEDALQSFNFRFPRVRYYSVDTSVRRSITPTLFGALSIGWSRQEQEGLAPANGYRTVLSLQWQGLERGH